MPSGVNGCLVLLVLILRMFSFLGLHALAQGAALELAPRGIRFNVVAPGYVTTDMTAHLDTDALCRDIPMGRLGQPEDVARAVEVRFLEIVNVNALAQ